MGMAAVFDKSRKVGSFLPILAAFFSMLFPVARVFASLDVEFNAALAAGGEWTYSNTTFYVRAPYNVRFDKSPGYAKSPEFCSPIRKIEVMGDYGGTNKKKKIVIAPVVDGAIDRDDPRKSVVADPVDEGIVVSNHYWKIEDDLRRFAIYSTGSDGVFSLAGARIWFYGSPESLVVRYTHNDGVTLAWRNSGLAKSVTVAVFRREVVPASYKVLKWWDFSSATNSTSSAVAVNGGYWNFEGLSPVGDVVIPAKSAGMIQVGSLAGQGLLMVEDVPEGAESLMIRCGKPLSNYGATMPVHWVDTANRTNSLTYVKLGNDMGEYMVGLAGVEPHSKLLVHNTTAKTRKMVNVQSLGLTSDYRGAVTSSVEVVRVNAGLAQEKFIPLAEPGDYTAYAVSNFPGGGESEPSGEVSFKVDPSAPHSKRGLILRFR